VLEINDKLLSPSIRVGIFNTKTSQNQIKVEYKPTQYRLFSVVEHQGDFAHRGHYVSYTMDSDDRWKCFDD